MHVANILYAHRIENTCNQTYVTLTEERLKNQHYKFAWAWSAMYSCREVWSAMYSCREVWSAMCSCRERRSTERLLFDIIETNMIVLGAQNPPNLVWKGSKFQMACWSWDVLLAVRVYAHTYTFKHTKTCMCEVPITWQCPRWLIWSGGLSLAGSLCTEKYRGRRRKIKSKLRWKRIHVAFCALKSRNKREIIKLESRLQAHSCNILCTIEQRCSRINQVERKLACKYIYVASCALKNSQNTEFR